MSSRLQKRKDGKYILQVLLPAARGELYVEYIQEELEQQVSNFTKQLIFDFLENNFSDQLYQPLKEKDEADWKAIVQKRIEGKKQAKEIAQTESESNNQSL
jgi:hypothetical protein